jgi:integrase/recombinase XerD
MDFSGRFFMGKISLYNSRLEAKYNEKAEVFMGLGKQAKVLSEHQLSALLAWLETRKHAERNRLIVLLSFKEALRAKEIASLKWGMVMDAIGEIGEAVHLVDAASKGKGGRIISMNKEVRKQLIQVKDAYSVKIDDADKFVIRTQRGERTSAQAIVNMFSEWYRKLGFVGCSSHSGRRTAITAWARKASLVGGSLRDVQSMAGHSSLQTTARYIERNSEAQQKLVNI